MSTKNKILHTFLKLQNGGSGILKNVNNCPLHCCYIYLVDNISDMNQESAIIFPLKPIFSCVILNGE